MAQYRMNAYDADVWIPEFKGLMQYGDQMGTDLRYSPDCMNVETPGGVLQPAPLLEGAKLPTSLSSVGIGGRAGVLMYLRQLVPRYNASGRYNNYNIVHSDDLPDGWDYVATDLYFFILSRSLYNPQHPGEDPKDARVLVYESVNRNLQEVGTLNGLRVVHNGNLPISGWSWTTYTESLTEDTTITDGSETCTLAAGTQTDILLFSHPDAGMFRYSVFEDYATAVETPAKFAYIARYAERIWGVGAGDKKDRIFCSRPYSATDWSKDYENPSQGGGEIPEPTFDDDVFTGLCPFGNSLIAFTKKRAWKITGTTPDDDMIIQEQYGNGTSYPETVVVFDDRIIMLGDEGLVAYDGDSVSPFHQEMTHELFRDIVVRDAKPKATRVGDKYVLSMANAVYYKEAPLDSYISIPNDEGSYIGGGSFPQYGINYYDIDKYQLIVYDTKDQTFFRMESPRVVSFAGMKPYMLTYTLDELDIPHYELVRLWFDSWNEKRITDKATKWVSPWVTFGRQDIKKGGFDFYFTPEIAKEESIEHQINAYYFQKNIPMFTTAQATGSVTFKISIQTESKTKTKTYTVNQLTYQQQSTGKQYKQKRLHFGGSGRRFRIIIETEAGNTIPWRLIGGIHIIAEIDKD